ncbi:MAG: hypothetical protein ABI394_01470 [Mycobacterium sp.]
MPEPTRQFEHVHRSEVTELGDGFAEGVLEIRQVRRDITLPEQRPRQGAAANEDLIGQFAPQHEVVGDPLAGLAFGSA